MEINPYVNTLYVNALKVFFYMFFLPGILIFLLISAHYTTEWYKEEIISLNRKEIKIEIEKPNWFKLTLFSISNFVFLFSTFYWFDRFDNKYFLIGFASFIIFLLLLYRLFKEVIGFINKKEISLKEEKLLGVFWGSHFIILFPSLYILFNICRLIDCHAYKILLLNSNSAYYLVFFIFNFATILGVMQANLELGLSSDTLPFSREVLLRFRTTIRYLVMWNLVGLIALLLVL